MACLAAGAAAARPPPAPPPSGIVVHPFGTAGAKPLPMPALLHRLFVTGDAQMKPGQALSPGRAGITPKT